MIQVELVYSLFWLVEKIIYLKNIITYKIQT
jgi:hypothetical protein